MRFIRRYRSLLVLGVFLVLCSIMVVRQINANQSKHTELREAFILLHTRGYRPEAERLYNRLLKDLHRLPTRLLRDDFQRTLTLVDPADNQPENLIWIYHWTVSNELEKRAESSLKQALKLAEEQ
jgi:hypothetical protein